MVGQVRPTAQQAIEYILGLLLVYGAVHVSESAAIVELAVAFVCVLLAATSPGKLAVRRLLGPRSRRVGDAVVGAGALAGAIATHDEALAVAPLLFAGAVLMKLALTRPFVAEPSGPLLPTIEAVQPHLNRAARLAGTLVRNRRNQKPR